MELAYTFDFIKNELKEHESDLKTKKYIDNVYEYQISDELSGMIKLAEKLNILNKQQLNELYEMVSKNNDIISEF